jgi:hypothetical protein
MRLPIIHTHHSDQPRPYLGPELRPHFILSQFKIEGSALVAFEGRCEVKTEHLVDWEDRIQNDFIRAKEMVHFLGEFFGITLAEGVWIQRWFATELRTQLAARGFAIERSGDDLYWLAADQSRRKLSVSIVTASPVSVLLHFGLNIDATGAPVQASGLAEMGLNRAQITELVDSMLRTFATEFEGVARACVKVRPVV